MQQPKCFSNLKKGCHGQGITVRVVRKWTHYEITGQHRPVFVGMVLADAKGEGIYAEISNDLIAEKQDLFQVGKVYVLKKFLVEDNKKSYRAVDNDLMIDIAQETIANVVADPPHTIPEYIYKLTPLGAIKPSRFIYNYTDVLGYLVKYVAAHTWVPKNTETPKTIREIYIKDLRENVMKITLWGDHATAFSIKHVYDKEAGNLVLCLIVGCYAREAFGSNDKVCLTASSSCFYYFNLNIPEAQAYYNRFKNTPLYIDCPEAEEEPFLPPPQTTLLPEKSIADLNMVDAWDEDEQGPFKCSVTVSSIINASNWWYMACTSCKKKAGQQPNGAYFCSKCHGNRTTPRYLLSFTASDETGEAKFFAYDDQAYKMIQRDCASVINPLQPRDQLPQPLLNILGKKFVFSVKLSKDSYKHAKNRQYEVKAVLQRLSPRNEATIEPAADVLQIEYPEKTTPPQRLEDNTNTPKDDHLSTSLMLPTNARRSLFTDNKSELQQIVEKPMEDKIVEHQTISPAKPPSSVVPKAKRAKITRKHGEETSDADM